MTLNKEELKAIDRKFEHPKEVVICPRCGKKLIFEEGKTSAEVRCETDGCIFDVVRGI